MNETLGARILEMAEAISFKFAVESCTWRASLQQIWLNLVEFG